MKSINNDYGFILKKISAEMETKFTKRLEPYGILPKHFGLLLIINEHGHIEQKKAGELLKSDRTSMVYIIDHLEELGYLKRVQNPKDRRCYSLKLNKKGKELIDPSWKILKEVEREVLGDLNPEQKKIFKDIYSHLDRK